MKKLGHDLTGMALGLTLTSISIAELYHPIFLSFAIGYAAYKGSNAPDYLEMAWFDKDALRRKSIIKHRTYTHWFLLWFFLFFLSLYGYFTHSLYWGIAIGYVLGAFLHLLMDLPNPTGVPFIYPTRKRVSLNWWKSGEHEGKISTLCFCLAFGVVYLLFKDGIDLFFKHPLVVMETIGVNMKNGLFEFFDIAIAFSKGLIDKISQFML